MSPEETNIKYLFISAWQVPAILSKFSDLWDTADNFKF